MSLFTRVEVKNHPGQSGRRAGIAPRYSELIREMRDLEIGQGFQLDPEIFGVDPQDPEAVQKLRANVASSVRRHLADLKAEGYRFRVYFDKEDNLIAARVHPIEKDAGSEDDDVDAIEGGEEIEYEEELVEEEV